MAIRSLEVTIAPEAADESPASSWSLMILGQLLWVTGVQFEKENRRCIAVQVVAFYRHPCSYDYCYVPQRTWGGVAQDR